MNFSNANYHDLPADDPAYNDDWRRYYAQRRTMVLRGAQSASGACLGALIIATVPFSIQGRYPIAFEIIGFVAALSILATVFQWFKFNWVLGGWTCPRCRESFFRSTLVRNPFGRRCRHCNLRRPTSSEIADRAKT